MALFGTPEDNTGLHTRVMSAPVWICASKFGRVVHGLK